MNMLTESDLALFKGYKIGRKKFRVRGKKLVRFAKAIGVRDDPGDDYSAKYVAVGETPDGKPDYSNVVAHPSYGAVFTLKALYASLGLNLLNEETGKRVVLCNDPGTLLNGGQVYNYEGCVPIRDGDKLTTESVVDEVYLKGDMLFLVTKLETTNQAGEPVLHTTSTVIVRKGGYGYVS
ncbi:MAG: FAS1-like dehydratase domain-containing protein [Promethearchaeota archaeon]